MVERENQLSQVILWPPHMNHVIYAHTQKSINNCKQKYRKHCQELRSGIAFNFYSISFGAIFCLILILIPKTGFLQTWDQANWPLPWKIWIHTSLISLPLCSPYRLVVQYAVSRNGINNPIICVLTGRIIHVNIQKLKQWTMCTN